MPAYAIGLFRTDNAPRHPEVLEYIERIQATLDPYSGRFLVHGGHTDVLEGEWDPDWSVVIIAFPGMDEARAWYASPAYQELVPLRTAHIDGEALLVEGVPPDYDPASTAEALRRRAAATRE